MTYGLIGDNNTQVDIIYSFPLVAIPKPAAVKSIQLMRELNGTKESVTEVIKGKALKAVADWVGTVPIGDLLGRNNKGDSLGKGRQVTTEPHPTKKEKLDTGGAPFEARLPIDPLRFNAGQFVDNDTSEKRAEDHRKNLAKYRYYWIVVDVDGNENEIDLKDAGPDKGKP